MSRTYDHRIREAIVRSGDPNLFPRLNISATLAPGSTTHKILNVNLVDGSNGRKLA